MLLDDSAGLMWDAPVRATRSADAGANAAARIAALTWDTRSYVQP